MNITLRLIILLVPLAPLASSAAEFYVSADGDDANQGTRQQPFATIQRGVEATRHQPGHLYATKDGYVLKNDDRHALVIVADRMPKDEDWRNYKHIRRDDERVVLPGKPRLIDFVMVPDKTRL